MRVLLLSAYDAASHRKWREGLVRHLGEHRWTVLTLPPRHFAWRTRGSALSWAHGERDVLEAGYDLVLATSMTDLASLRGMVPKLAATPTVVYFHENQFAYPDRVRRRESLHVRLTGVYTALAADRVLFNSAWNRDSFLEGTRGLLAVMPDGVPEGVVELLGARSAVLPVPLEAAFLAAGKRSPLHGPLTLLWNHRWEHDKAPERFFGALRLLAQRKVPFKVHVLGQRFREAPPSFEEARAHLGERIGQWGYVQEDEAYRNLLASCDVVVSTALHDFQGLAVLEAAAAGCLPLVPDRLAYPEFFGEGFRYPSSPDDAGRETGILAARLEAMCRDPEMTRRTPPPDLSRLSWENQGPRYRELLEEASGVPPSPGLWRAG
ncbi:MAG: DUF3524 domain-containing protein [bacterium]|nr:MAG: DUF3524 domain-containing protein [bacterium]